MIANLQLQLRKKCNHYLLSSIIPMHDVGDLLCLNKKGNYASHARKPQLQKKGKENNSLLFRQKVNSSRAHYTLLWHSTLKFNTPLQQLSNCIKIKQIKLTSSWLNYNTNRHTKGHQMYCFQKIRMIIESCKANQTAGFLIRLMPEIGIKGSN